MRAFALFALLVGTVAAANLPQQIHLGRADVDGTAFFVSWLSAASYDDAFVVYGTQPNALNLRGKQAQPPLQYTYKSQVQECLT